MFELTISEVSRAGAGVARDTDGRTIFVPFTAPGDIVNVRLCKSKPRYAEAELLEVIKASPQRKSAPCPVFTQCGGCQWQHLPYDLQWKIKCDGLTESLRRAGINHRFNWDEYPAKTIWGYRNRIQLRRRGSQLGFYASRSHKIVAIRSCAIARPEINDAITKIQNDIPADAHPGRESSKIELSMSVQGDVHISLDRQHADQGFRQVNDEQNLNLQLWIKRSITTVSGVLDLYGGSGNLCLGLADSVAQIHCVDLHIAQGSETHPSNISFYQSAVRPWLERRYEQNKYSRKPSTGPESWLAIIDPPRGGLDKEGDAIIHYLKKLNVSTIILIGCKSDPWSRDVAKFITAGWDLQKVAIFDFFPQTIHVESAALLIKVK